MSKVRAISLVLLLIFSTFALIEDYYWMEWVGFVDQLTRLTRGGPAERAGLMKGDIIIGVGGKRIGTMIEFFRKLRTQGSAGAQIQLDILPAAATDLSIKKINVKSLDRHDWLKMN